VPGEPILIVDDNPSNMKLMTFLLDKLGYDVRTAIDAGEVFSTLAGFKPRLILMDLQLPGMDGYEITRRIKADPALRDVVVIAITAYAMKGDEQRALAAGCDAYVTKPIDTRALPEILQRHLGAAARVAGP
jgi:two-component system, cell cycle response regulator DivK